MMLAAHGTVTPRRRTTVAGRASAQLRERGKETLA